MSESKLIFMTGITGYVGCHLAHAFLQQGHQVVALVRDGGADNPATLRARTAVAQVAETLTFAPDHLIVVPGDVREPADRLLAKIRDQIDQPVDEVWHCAATFKFRPSEEDEIRAINIEGVRTILQVVLGLNDGVPPRYFHVSTAYSSGQEHEFVPEAITAASETYRTLYEWSKHEGEALVNTFQRAHGLDAAIFRPSIIVGSEHTRVFNDSAYYQVCAALYRLRKYLANSHGPDFDGALNVRLMGNPEMHLNLVPVDYLVQGMLRLAAEPALVGPRLKVFNLVNEEPPTQALIHEVVCRSLNITGLKLLPPEQFDRSQMNRLERMLARHVAFQEPYMREEIRFSTEKFRRYVPTDMLPTPVMNATFLATINRLFFEKLEEKLQRNGRV